uniref:Uncharacterized protein n=1 Tax=Knipowitschia caucasica TaxID=637954 RepID=A0AAV2JJP0_KNICA
MVGGGWGWVGVVCVGKWGEVFGSFCVVVGEGGGVGCEWGGEVGVVGLWMVDGLSVGGGLRCCGGCDVEWEGCCRWGGGGGFEWWWEWGVGGLMVGVWGGFGCVGGWGVDRFGVGYRVECCDVIVWGWVGWEVGGWWEVGGIRCGLRDEMVLLGGGGVLGLSVYGGGGLWWLYRFVLVVGVVYGLLRRGSLG